MDAFVQSKLFRVLLILILVALFVFAVSLQLEPPRGAVSAAESRLGSASYPQYSSTPATLDFDLPAEIRDQPSLIDGF